MNGSALRTEAWQIVPTYPDYEVSDLGNIRSWRGRGGRRLPAPKALRPAINHDGYPVISLVGADGRRGQCFVHRLVAAAFLGPIPDGRVVAHGNGDRSDARLGNLRYATPRENEADKAAHGTKLVGERHPRTVVTDEVVRAIRQEHAAGSSQVSLARKYGTHQTNVSLIVRGLTRRTEDAS